MEKVFCNGLIQAPTMEHSTKVICTDKEHINGKMADNFKELTTTISWKATVSLLG